MTQTASMTWNELPRAAFDLETTGTDPETARIVTASVIVVNGKSEIVHHNEWLVDPGVEIPEGAAAVHGITTAKARAEGQDAASAVAEITAHLRDLFATMPVMAFNAAYDFTLLSREAARYGVEPLAPAPVIDPLVIDRHVDKYRRGKRTLEAMAEFYQVPLNNAHTSLADAAATIGVADAIASRYAEVRIDPFELHAAQVNWQQAWAANFQEFLRRKSPEALVDGTWPLKPAF
ncbi:3'-5' exonuclease [Zhihengliuella halotolerans]|uniref:DNA polymerase-3 subunit epsilon n=1 Tax=Zhihengliuella halotolerans TaxID=370736 RepID=A0A4Q8AAB3_9MICC|nr:3'-5' exonuclease [Zhihengliuella halotolerans]RZU61042.1 DNA polymerase-3 subunit epsilon [Zhihengliuella halotolerans]